MRARGRGKRWLLLRRWKTIRGSKRRELAHLFAVNRRLFRAYVLREQLDRLWTYRTREGVALRASSAAHGGCGMRPCCC
jgi:Transposase